MGTRRTGRSSSASSLIDVAEWGVRGAEGVSVNTDFGCPTFTD
jgi:hypothetical protein